MQIVLSGNRIVAHGEDCFLCMGGTVVCRETGRVFQNATVAECEGCPSDIDSVGYEYHAGVFVPVAPYGTAEDGHLMVACDCGTPKRAPLLFSEVLALVNTYASVTVKYPAGAVCTCTNGEITQTADDSGEYEFRIPKPGTWTFTITDGEETSSVNVVINKRWQSESLAIAFFAAYITVTYPAGAVCTCSNGSTTLTADTSGNYTFKIPKSGVWTVTVTSNGETKSNAVAIGENMQRETVDLLTPFTSVNVSIYGAPGETITVSDDSGVVLSGVVLNANGKSKENYELPVGTYSIKGSVSQEIFTHGRTAEITTDTTVITAYPPGAIFWFGNGDATGDSLYSESGFTFSAGHRPNSVTESNTTGYTEMESTDTTIGVTASCPNSAGSRYAGTTYSPPCQLAGYSYVNFYASCSPTTRVAFGFPGEKKTQWATTNMFVTPTTTDYELYSMSTSGRTAGYFAMSTFNVTNGATSAVVSAKAIWMDTTNQVPQGTMYESTVSIPTDETYRYCNHIAGGFRTGYDESYVGQGERVAAGEEWNAMMIPVPAFSFTGTGLRLKMALRCYKPYDDDYTFRWAVTTSRANESLYAEGCGAVTDANQIMAGTFSPAYNNGAVGYQTFTLEGGEIPADTPLYIYLWRNVSTYGNIHVTSYVNITLQYMVE